jgi:hypothetical protein
MPAARSLTALAVTLATALLAGCSESAESTPPPTTSRTAPSVTAAPSSTPTSLGAKAKLLAAYMKSWEIYADALRRLDPSRLPTAFDGAALRAVRSEVAAQKAQGQPVRIDVEHDPKVLLLRGPRLVTLPSVVLPMPLGEWCSSTRRGTRAARAAPSPAPGRAP